MACAALRGGTTGAWISVIALAGLVSTAALPANVQFTSWELALVPTEELELLATRVARDGEIVVTATSSTRIAETVNWVSATAEMRCGRHSAMRDVRCTMTSAGVALALLRTVTDGWLRTHAGAC